MGKTRTEHNRRPGNPGRKSGQKKRSRRALSQYATEKYRQANLLSRVLGAIVIQAGGSFRLPKGAINLYKPGVDKLDAHETETGAVIIEVTRKETKTGDAAPTAPMKIATELPARPVIPPLTLKEPDDDDKPSPIIDPSTNRPVERRAGAVPDVQN